MNQKLYYKIVNFIRLYKGLPINCLNKLLEMYPSVSKDALSSILAYEYQIRMRSVYSKSLNARKRYWNIYTNSLDKFESPGIILRIAEKEGIAPCLIAKLILQEYFKDGVEENEEPVNVHEYLKDTSSIPDMDLAYEVFLCVSFDNLYSPVAETMRNSIGQQYEIQLYKQAVKLGLAFRDEDYLRQCGYDRTPDIKLEIPISIDGFLVNWIESKALFGTVGAHKDYTSQQYLRYWNRFGPGLVIYWFGFVETIASQSNKCFIIRDHLPSNIVQLKQLDN